jgi:hypothetical protein
MQPFGEPHGKGRWRERGGAWRRGELLKGSPSFCCVFLLLQGQLYIGGREGRLTPPPRNLAGS